MESMVFPNLKEDGTFDIRLEFFPEVFVEKDAVNRWITSWLQENDPWVRRWRGAGDEVAKTDRLRFLDSFVTAPRCVGASSSSVLIRLTGRGSDAYWKDWMVRMIEEITNDLGLRFDRATDN
jgi:hypothetical protein